MLHLTSGYRKFDECIGGFSGVVPCLVVFGRNIYIFIVYTLDILEVLGMTTEMITLKLEGVFLKEIDSIVAGSGYQSRTEFIRNALREKVEEWKLKSAMMELAHLKGVSKKKTSDGTLEKLREKAFAELEKRF